MAAKKSAAKKPAAKKKPEPSANDTFEKLRTILVRHAKELVVAKDTPEWYYLDTKSLAPNGKPLMFGAVRNGKAYTSYYLFPVYMDPKLLNGLSPELKKRMQGKSCFNFKTIDGELFDELSALTKKCFDAFKKSGAISAARSSR